ncbi:hypothetical protein F5Y19DRAFT_423624 [Xylariaceae sp. FL1651]|nr:hypothetical protein F5Y19DRAFT_423624 [Xylariaceae sp. FL1651]
MDRSVKARVTAQTPIVESETREWVKILDDGKSLYTLFHAIKRHTLLQSILPGSYEENLLIVMLHSSSRLLLRSLMLGLLGPDLYHKQRRKDNWEHVYDCDDTAGSYAAFIHIRRRHGAFLTTKETKGLIKMLLLYADAVDIFARNKEWYGHSQMSSEEITAVSHAQIVGDVMRSDKNKRWNNNAKDLIFREPRFGASEGASPRSQNIRLLVAMLKLRCSGKPEEDTIQQQSPMMVGNAGILRNRMNAHYPDSSMDGTAKVWALTISCLKLMALEVDTRLIPFFLALDHDQIDPAEILGTVLASSALPGHGFNIKRPGTRGTNGRTSDFSFQNARALVYVHNPWLKANIRHTLKDLPPHETHLAAELENILDTAERLARSTTVLTQISNFEPRARARITIEHSDPSDDGHDEDKENETARPSKFRRLDVEVEGPRVRDGVGARSKKWDTNHQTLYNNCKGLSGHLMTHFIHLPVRLTEIDKAGRQYLNKSPTVTMEVLLEMIPKPKDFIDTVWTETHEADLQNTFAQDHFRAWLLSPESHVRQGNLVYLPMWKRLVKLRGCFPTQLVGVQSHLQFEKQIDIGDGVLRSDPNWSSTFYEHLIDLALGSPCGSNMSLLAFLIRWTVADRTDDRRGVPVQDKTGNRFFEYLDIAIRERNHNSSLRSIHAEIRQQCKQEGFVIPWESNAMRRIEVLNTTYITGPTFALMGERFPYYTVFTSDLNRLKQAFNSLTDAGFCSITTVEDKARLLAHAKSQKDCPKNMSDLTKIRVEVLLADMRFVAKRDLCN